MEPAEEMRRPWHRIALDEVRARPLSYLLMAAFLVGGPVAAHFLFPQAPFGVGIVGGLAFGIYAALCTAPQKFI